ncbi:hypothetical protein [Rhodanobacter sp. OK091]|uniref:hypothetical protein n=1 Tax=Rhodanobacter sp. OK091 TaxID=1881037 RepID=UPI0011608EDE|nr:hypothetical protein [Rhodanobacter sp. OK091]
MPPAVVSFAVDAGQSLWRRRAGGWRSAVGMRNSFDSTKSQIHITHVKSVVIGFAFGRFAWQRSLLVLDDMSGKLDTVYCVLVVAAAVLVGIVKCTNCDSFKAP